MHKHGIFEVSMQIKSTLSFKLFEGTSHPCVSVCWSVQHKGGSGHSSPVRRENPMAGWCRNRIRWRGMQSSYQPCSMSFFSWVCEWSILFPLIFVVKKSHTFPICLDDIFFLTITVVINHWLTGMILQEFTFSSSHRKKMLGENLSWDGLTAPSCLNKKPLLLEPFKRGYTQ